MNSYEENILTRVFDSVTDPFTIYDREFRILKVNKALRELFRTEEEQLIGKFCYEVFYQRSTICHDCHVQEVFRTGKPLMLEKRVPVPSGGERIFEVHSYPIKDHHGETIQAVEHGRDITERKNLENQLQVSRKFNEEIINSITDSLTVVDPETFTILQANDAFHARVGLEPQKSVGQRCHEIMLHRSTPCMESGIKCPLEETIRTKSPTLSDKIYPNAEGVERLLEVATYPLLDMQGEISSIIRLERDVTEKRRMEEALAFRSKELQKTQHQLETLFELSRQVSNKNSFSELIDFVLELSQQLFPDTDLLLFFLDSESKGFLPWADVHSHGLKPSHRAQEKIERSELVADFLQYLRRLNKHSTISPKHSNDIPAFLKVISKSYGNWFGLPISSPLECIGYAVVGSINYQDYPREDAQFLLTFFSQIAGYIRHLIVHQNEINHLRERVAEKTSHGKIIGQSEEMQRVYELIDLVAGSDATVLITGENGTGKELVAQAIHRQSHRRKGPFIAANCSAYSPTLLESELFGHEKGAFTGAIKRKMGRIERAKGGTLFLDEIGDIAAATQVLLLRFLQDHSFERVGGEQTLEADVRVLAATNRDLYREVEEGRFRDDLYYRLNVISIHLPPLCDRIQDIPLLAKHFLGKYTLKEGKAIHSFSSGAMQLLMDYDWPGNVRQLENAISHAVILAQDTVIERRHLPQFLRQTPTDPPSTSLAENERRLILGVLQESSWNKHEAARRLKISRSTLYSKIRRYSLKRGATPV
ncbi:MAG: sigma-54-dependent Fis family transcriptional regulator [Deltaproteobacteria bacterium]